MKKIIFFMAAIAIFASCNNDVIEMSNSLDGYTFVHERSYEDHTLTCYLEFGKPQKAKATITESISYTSEQKSQGGIESPVVYYYSLNGSLITFKYTNREQENQIACYMTYQNDSIYSGNCVYYRK